MIEYFEDIKSKDFLEFFNKHKKQIINLLYKMDLSQADLLSQLGSPQFVTFKPSRRSEKEVLGTFQNKLVSFILENDYLIGYCLVSRKYFFDNSDSYNISEIYIDDNYRGKGFGKTLIKKTLSYIRKIYKGHIFLSVISTNTLAIKLYKDLGFKPFNVTMGIVPSFLKKPYYFKNENIKEISIRDLYNLKTLKFKRPLRETLMRMSKLPQYKNIQINNIINKFKHDDIIYNVIKNTTKIYIKMDLKKTIITDFVMFTKKENETFCKYFCLDYIYPNIDESLLYMSILKISNLKKFSKLIECSIEYNSDLLTQYSSIGFKPMHIRMSLT